MSQEVVFSHKTRGNSSPKDKPRVYFTCHPDDFERYFEKICEDIFKTHDCTVYYTDDMNADLSDENNLVDLERMNLFVIPVTFRLLTQPNRAMDSDFRFAMGKHIPVLPMMMEPGIDEFYSKPDKFDELQYINPYSHDLTEISYEEKLKKYLESVLISDELARRVRKAFNAYIFLSYRKKDRAYANDLMKLIHKNPECRDIAIWFDEFLTPGESFKENIDRILQNSEMFALLVTPNLLEKPEGKPNFVMAEEYPAARAFGKEVLPAEMEQTDRSTLSSSFAELPECVDARNDKEFRERLLESLKRVAISENNNDPEHNYLIGLAYLEGIDVEKNVDLGLELVTISGEAGLFEAMQKLRDIYYFGQNITLNWSKSLYWSKQLYIKCADLYGDSNKETLKYHRSYALLLRENGKYKESLIETDIVYKLYCTQYEINDEEKLRVLSDLATSYHFVGNTKKAIELIERCVEESNNLFSWMEYYSNLGVFYSELGEYDKAMKFALKNCDIHMKAYGEEHPDTLIALNNLAVCYNETGDYKKAAEILNKALNTIIKVQGENHPNTFMVLNNLSVSYISMKDFQNALKIQKKLYSRCCNVLGPKHPKTLVSLNNLASIYSDLHETEKAQLLLERVYKLRCETLGDDHPKTAVALSNLALVYSEEGKYDKAIECQTKAYLVFRKKNENSPETIASLQNLVSIKGDSGRIKEAIEIQEQVYHLRCAVLGDKHPDTVASLNNLLLLLDQDLLEKKQEVYKLMCKLYGENDERTISALKDLASDCFGEEIQE